MKQFKFYALCLAGLMFLASACEKPVPEPEAELTASEESLTLPAQAAASSIKVTSNQKWTASSDADWLRLSPESGENDGEIAVEATDNVAPAGQRADSRSAVITIQSEKISVRINVVQAEEAVIFLAEGIAAEIPAEGATLVANVESNVSYSVDLSADWLSKIESKAAASSEVKIAAAANESMEERSATITIVPQSGKPKSFTVNQAGIAPVLNVSKNSILFDSESPVADTIKVESNIEWEAVCEETWVSLSTPEEGVIVVNAKVNAAPAGERATARTATIKLTSELLPDVNISVEQDPEKVILLGSGEYNVDASTHILAVKISSNAPILNITRDVDWLNAASSRAVQEDYLFIQVSSNNDLADRTGNLTIAAEGVDPITVKVVQKGMTAVNTANITSFEEWKAFVAAPEGITAINITSDIDCGGEEIPSLSSFDGYVKGQNHYFKNGSLSKPLIEVNNGTVSGVCIDKTVSTKGVGNVFAAIVGVNNGRVIECVNEADILPKFSTSAPFIAGVVAKSTGTVESCVNKGKIGYLVSAAASGTGSVAGVVALASGSEGQLIVSGCENLGDVIVVAQAKPGYIRVGGVLGSTETHKGTQEVNQGIVFNCRNAANVRYVYTTGGTGAYPNCGGVAGVVEGYMTGCLNTGAVSIENESFEVAWTCAHVAGVAAQCAFGADHCTNSGDVSATGAFAGGTKGAALAGVDGSGYSCFAGVFASAGVYKASNAPTKEIVFSDCVNTVPLTFEPKMVASGGPGMVFGGVIGACSGTMKNCKNTAASFTVNSQTKKTYIGAVAGAANDIIGAEFNGDLVYDVKDIVVTGHQCYVGGIIGYSYYSGAVYDNLIASGNVTVRNFPKGTDDILHYVGGLLGGYKGSMTLSNSSAKVNVIADNPLPMRVGGLAGAFNGLVENCEYEGKISAAGAFHSTNSSSGYCAIGGVTGYLNGTLKDCRIKAEISGGAKENSLLGGLAGCLGYNTTVDETYFRGGSVDCSFSTEGYAGCVLGGFNEGVSGKKLNVEGVTLPTPVNGLYNGVPILGSEGSEADENTGNTVVVK